MGTHLRALERPHTARRMARAQSPRHRIRVPRDPRRVRAQQRVVARRQRPAAAVAAFLSGGLLLVYDVWWTAPIVDQITFARFAVPLIYKIDAAARILFSLYDSVV